jgi:hypothetical protein
MYTLGPSELESAACFTAVQHGRVLGVRCFPILHRVFGASLNQHPIPHIFAGAWSLHQTIFKKCDQLCTYVPVFLLMWVRFAGRPGLPWLHRPGAASCFLPLLRLSWPVRPVCGVRRGYAAVWPRLSPRLSDDVSEGPRPVQGGQRLYGCPHLP